MGKSNPEGLVRIELFSNKDKTKVGDIKTHNFISKRVRDNMYKYMINGLFTKGISGVDAALRDMAVNINNPFGVLMVTTADHEESPDTERDLKGRILGYADINETYSGDSEYRGTLNLSETLVTRETVRLVFDFPTQASNGTFQSLYFLPYDRPITRSERFQPELFKTLNSSGVLDQNYLSASIDRGNGRFAIRTSRTDVSIYDMNFNHITDLTPPSPDINSIAILLKGRYLYYKSQTSFIKYDIDTETVSNSISQRTNYFGVPIYDETTNSIFLIEKYLGSIRLIEDMYYTNYDMDLNQIGGREIKNLLGLDESSSRSPFRPDGSIMAGYIEDGQVFLTFATGFSRDVYETHILDLNMEEGSAVMLPVQPDIFMCDWDEDYLLGGRGTLIPKGIISSRVLLPQPVTKTATNTMKITYEFVLPKF